ncbi:hypothetical protein J6590_042029 [Homalodisca vitripennis]|nr:hypothetical protein J6590_042029 [Homalodisca vitripennis]
MNDWAKSASRSASEDWRIRYGLRIWGRSSETLEEYLYYKRRQLRPLQSCRQAYPTLILIANFKHSRMYILGKVSGRTGQVLDNHNIEEEKLGEEDGLVILCGTNDVAINNAQDAIKNIELVLNKITSTVSKIVVVDIPRRYDLVEWSCVNQEVKKTNCALKEMCNKFRDVSLVEVSRAERHLHTRHGMHLNRRGKMWLAHQIARVLDSKQEQETYNVSPTLRTGSEESVADAMMTTEISTPTTEDSTTSSGNSPLQTPTHNR